MRRIELPPKQCPFCSVLFYRRKNEQAFDFRRRKFCCIDHYFKWNQGANHYNFKNGQRTRPDGYLRFSNDKYVHRAVLEKHLGRSLGQNEIVHHIDGNPSNNDISNLEITTNSEHRKKHVVIQPRGKDGRFI